jgi:predicted nucleic acid-binding protein
MANLATNKNLLFDSLPKTIYFDTNFVVYSLTKQKKHYYKNLACRYFISRLLESTTKIYFSAIIFPEFWYAALKIAIAENEGYKEERQVYNYLRKHKKEAVKEYISFIKNMQASFDNLIDLLNKKEQRVYVVETKRIISEEALRFMDNFQLLSYDAVHFASATIKISTENGELEKPSVFDFATIDSDFEKVNCEYLKLWNRGCEHKSILKYEKKLHKNKLQPDGILAKETNK